LAPVCAEVQDVRQMSEHTTGKGFSAKGSAWKKAKLETGIAGYESEKS
jgi:hypothetical protein